MTDYTLRLDSMEVSIIVTALSNVEKHNGNEEIRERCKRTHDKIMEQIGLPLEAAH
jgi:hypothetical protein